MNTIKALTKAAGFPLILASAFLTEAGCSGGMAQISQTGGSSSDMTAARSPNDLSTLPLSPASLSLSTASTNYARSSSNAISYHGCAVFAPGDWYNADITTAAVDAHSSSYINSVTATDNTGFYGSSGTEQVNFATTSTKTYVVKPKVSWHKFPVPYPVPANPFIEPGGDGHYIALLVSSPRCHLYESYSTTFNGSTLSAYSGTDWDLSAPYKVLPNNTASSMASGLSMFAGMVKHDELATGIHHALNFSMFAHSPCNCYTAPASSTDGLAYYGPNTGYAFPYGGHLRLKASFDNSRFGPQSRAITEALKHYGMYLADTGGAYANNNALYLANPTDGGSWNKSDLASLGELRYSDFEVIKLGAVIAR